MLVDNRPKLERSLNVTRCTDDERPALMFYDTLEFREIDLHDFIQQSRPELPEALSHLGRINAGAVVCDMGGHPPYIHAEPNDVFLVRVFIETEDHSHYAVIEAKTFVCPKDSPGPFTAGYEDTDWALAFMTQDRKLTKDAARVWRVAEDELPDAFVSLQGFCLSKEFDTPEFLAYLVEMARWVVMEHLPCLDHCGFTLQAKPIETEKSPYPSFSYSKLKKYEKMIVSALNATRVAKPGRPLSESVFLLANDHPRKALPIRRRERTG